MPQIHLHKVNAWTSKSQEIGHARVQQEEIQDQEIVVIGNKEGAEEQTCSQPAQIGYRIQNDHEDRFEDGDQLQSRQLEELDIWKQARLHHGHS